jgi:transposase
MSKALKIEIKETLSELRAVMRKSIPMISLRVKMLVCLKKHDGSLSRRKLASKIGVDDKSIQSWRKTYIEGGLSALLRHEKKGSVSKIFGEEEQKFLDEILSNPKNGVQGYTELQRRMSKHFDKEFKYITLVKHCERHFGTKIKVARPSHVKKDENAVSDLKKKTLLVNSKRSQKKQVTSTQKFQFISKTKAVSD